MINQKTRHIQRYHAECLRLSPLQRMQRSPPLAENGRQKCSVVDVGVASNDCLKCFSPDNNQNTLSDISIDGTVFAREIFT